MTDWDLIRAAAQEIRAEQEKIAYPVGALAESGAKGLFHTLTESAPKLVGRGIGTVGRVALAPLAPFAWGAKKAAGGAAGAGWWGAKKAGKWVGGEALHLAKTDTLGVAGVAGMGLLGVGEIRRPREVVTEARNDMNLLASEMRPQVRQWG